MTKTKTLEEARALLKVGTKIRAHTGWVDDSIAERRVVPGDLLEVLGLDGAGDPLFGDRSRDGSIFADDVLERAEIVEPAHAPPQPFSIEDSPESVTLGACYQDPNDREIARVVQIEPVLLVDILARCGFVFTGALQRVEWASGPRAFRDVYETRVADPTPAVIDDAPPSTDDAKPRGVKPPLALIPWECMPDANRGEVIRESTHPERVIAILFGCEGDEFANDVARAFEHGAAKYGLDNWRGIEWTPKASLEYRSAMLRHLYADAIGEQFDPDSGVSHRAHACASAMIHVYHERRAAERATGSA